MTLTGEARKKYAHQYYCDHKDQYLRQNRERRLANKRWLDSLKDEPCVGCHLKWPPCVMDFHHRDPASKLFSVSRALTNKGRQYVLQEIAKCDLLCANCHRIQEHGGNVRFESVTS